MTSLVLIAGVARSGSTVTDFILGNRSDSFSLGEVYAWYRPFRPHHRQPSCNCGLSATDCPVWSSIGRPRARHLHREVASALERDIIVDSSKNLGWIYDTYRWAQRDGLRVEIVMPWRGTKAIAQSYWKRGVGRWAENLEGYLHRLHQLGLPWRPLHFDQLIVNPCAVLAPLYDDLGTAFESGQERFWEGTYHSMFGSGRTRSQVGLVNSSLGADPFQPEFESYWESLDDSFRSRMEELDELVIARLPGRDERPSLPPSWYWKQRGLAVRDRVRLAIQPNRNIR